MGQRLNIEIKKDNETLANCYYHWSGYTSSALNLTKIILENIKPEQEITQNYAIELLKSTGADFGKDRNAGLIGITEKDIKETRYWEEARVEIDLLNKNIQLNIYWSIDEQDIEKYPKDYEDVTFPKLGKNPFEIPFEEFSLMNTIIQKNIKDNHFYFEYNNNKYVYIV